MEEKYLSISCSHLKALTLIPTQHEPLNVPSSISGPRSVRVMGFAGRGMERGSVHVWLSQLHDKSKPCHAKTLFLTVAEMGTTQTEQEAPQGCWREEQETNHSLQSTSGASKIS